MTRPTLPPFLRRTLYLRRRPLAALCAFLAVLATLLALAPSPAPMVTVYGARAALPAGTILTAEHLVPLALPPEAVPDGAASAEADVLGRALGGPVSARTAITQASVSDGERLARPGHVVIALPVTDASIAALVRPGVRLDVLDQGGEFLATDVPVIAPPGTPSDGPLEFGAPSRSVLVEVPQQVAAKLASQGMTSVTVALR